MQSVKSRSSAEIVFNSHPENHNLTSSQLNRMYDASLVSRKSADNDSLSLSQSDTDSRSQKKLQHRESRYSSSSFGSDSSECESEEEEALVRSPTAAGTAGVGSAPVTVTKRAALAKERRQLCQVLAALLIVLVLVTLGLAGLFFAGHGKKQSEFQVTGELSEVDLAAAEKAGEKVLRGDMSPEEWDKLAPALAGNAQTDEDSGPVQVCDDAGNCVEGNAAEDLVDFDTDSWQGQAAAEPEAEDAQMSMTEQKEKRASWRKAALSLAKSVGTTALLGLALPKTMGSSLAVPKGFGKSVLKTVQALSAVAGSGGSDAASLSRGAARLALAKSLLNPQTVLFLLASAALNKGFEGALTKVQDMVPLPDENTGSTMAKVLGAGARVVKHPAFPIILSIASFIPAVGITMAVSRPVMIVAANPKEAAEIVKRVSAKVAKEGLKVIAKVPKLKMLTAAVAGAASAMFRRFAAGKVVKKFFVEGTKNNMRFLTSNADKVGKFFTEGTKSNAGKVGKFFTEGTKSNAGKVKNFFLGRK